MKNLKALSFFSGAMGLDLGLKKAGIEIILACESEKFIRETIKLNNPKLKVLEDINLYSAQDIRKEAGLKKNDKIDLIVGGPPCQAFSTAGKRLSINENRGVVFIKYLELIKELNPTYFVIENVRGLLSVPLKHVPHNNRKSKLKTVEEKGGTLQYILNYLKKCGYKVSFNLYNSANFGTPQIRERIVIMGNKKDKLPYLSPTHSELGEFGLKKWNTFKSAVKGLHNIKHDHVKFPDKRIKYYKKLKEGQNWKNLSKALQKEALGNSYYVGGGKTGFLRRLGWNKPSPTLVTDPTIPADKGVFLNVTRRLNNKICDYISSSFYDSRLTSDSITKTRSVNLKLNPIKDEGIFYVPIDHSGCSQRSDEEADLVEKTFNKIINRDFKNGKATGKISAKDIMVVAPYNAQANNIRERLKNKYDDVRVGTIDLFQGQEAKVVLISMTTSDVDSLPRHKDFFFSRNRLNVAISRAECVAIIIFNENLLLASTNSIKEMKLINSFCKLLKFKTNYK